MSTVKAINFQHPSASAANITLASDGTVTGGIPSPNRNLLYNGAMQVSQRGTSTASITAGGYYTADRWNVNISSLGTWTQSVENDAPTGSGFRKSLKMLCTTADASPAAGDLVRVAQALEGQDCQRIAKGTSSAQQLTLSFWVKSNVTGTYIAEIVDGDNTRFVSASYTISASATWERKTITFPADTTGVLDNDNAESLALNLWLGAGSTYTSGTLGTTWHTTAANRAVGQTNLAAATNNYWQVTGVQLEVGSQATAFEFKSYQQDLRECQRYCIGFFGAASAVVASGPAGQYSDANQMNMLMSTSLASMRAPGSTSLTTVGTQGTDWAVQSSAGVNQTGFTVISFPYGGISVSKTAHGLTQANIQTLTTSGRIIISSEL